MKSGIDWTDDLLKLGLGEPRQREAIRFVITQIQIDAYQDGQAATMKWVSEECKKMLASIPVEHHHKD